MSGSSVASPPPSPGRGPRRGLELAVLVVTALGVLVALLAWLLPRDPGGGDDGGRAEATGRATTPPPTGAAGGGAGSATAATAPPRFLTELTPAVGGGFVQRVGARSLRMACGTGESDDREREVTYDVPAAGYRSFRTTARPTGQRETRVRVTALVTGVVRAEPVVVAGSSAGIDADLQGPSRLTLRITCEPGAASVTFVDPALYR